MLNSTEHEISPVQINKVLEKGFLALKLSDVVFIMLINVDMPIKIYLELKKTP